MAIDRHPAGVEVSTLERERRKSPFTFKRLSFNDAFVEEICKERGIKVADFERVWPAEQVRQYREFVIRNADLPGYDCESRHNPTYHMFNIWDHSMVALVYAIVARIELRLDIREAALLHDLGKYFHFQVGAEGEYTFHGHGERGAEILAERESNFPWHVHQETIFLVGHHECPNLRKNTIASVASVSHGVGTQEFRKLTLLGLIDWAAKGRTCAQEEQKRQLTRLTREMALLADVPEGLIHYLLSK
ncbi:MAG TPA: HD domain-containing protein [Patescibacteria group bacterium]|nr:HD domain-containing protein [Patescibacteria group bacterium]